MMKSIAFRDGNQAADEEEEEEAITTRS